MAFSQATMIGDPVIGRSGNELLVTWDSTDAGATYQLYLNGRLYWSGQAKRLMLPWPTGSIHVDVGTVLASEASTNFAGSLPATPATRVKLEWDGGTWESPDIQGYYIYASPRPGAAISYARPLATVPFATGPFTYDGYGRGGYGVGGYGAGDAHFSWTSGSLLSGVWLFAVAPFDSAGNVQSSHLTTSATIAGPPQPPLATAAGKRLWYTLSGGYGRGGYGRGGYGSGDALVPTLYWNASPSA